MKAVTLWEPWASLWMLGMKRFETRSWSTSHRGPTAVHASKRFTQEQRELCLTEPFRTPLLEAGLIDLRGGVHFALGAVVGTVDLVAMWRMLGDGVIAHAETGARLLISEPELSFGDFSKGRFAWESENNRRLDRPVFVAGKQGLWEWQVPEGVGI